MRIEADHDASDDFDDAERIGDGPLGDSVSAPGDVRWSGRTCQHAGLPV